MLNEIFDKDTLVGIFGFGVTGHAAAKWCNEHGVRTLIFDNKSKDCERFSEGKVSECNIIIRSPSFLNDNPWVVFAASRNIRCLSELDLAAHFWRGKIVAVTGTDGKTTATEFLAHALIQAGCCAVAVGNNGQSLLEYVDGEVNQASSFAVVEVSSFQASELSILHPDYVIWTNFAQDHLNVHGSLKDYFAAKYNLVTLCREPDDEHVFIGKSVARSAEEFSGFDLLNERNVHTKITHLPADSMLNISVQHENYALIEALWNALKLPTKVLESAALSFKLPEHRLQRIATISKPDGSGGVEFWNDSKATNFHSFQAAIHSFNKKLILIVGGRSKGEDLGQYVEEISQRASSVLLMGETGEQLYQILSQKKYEKRFNLLRHYGGGREHAEEIISKITNDAFCVALPGDVVLLSPGFASFDMFTCFEERGEFYKKSVLRLSF